MRLIVCGCRDWSDAAVVRQRLHQLVSARGPLVIIHGACPTGADHYASLFAADPMSHCTEYRWPADWGRGPKAGPERNEAMAAAGTDLLLAFWDGRSSGTRDMIERAVRHGIPVRIVAKAVGA